MGKKSLKSLADSAAAARASLGNAEWDRLMQVHKEGVISSLNRQLQDLQDWMNSPESKARDKLEGELKKLMQDPIINTSETCVELLEVFVHCLTYGWSKPGSAEVLQPIGDEYKRLQSRSAVDAQHAKRRAAMDFVRRDWAAHRTDYGGNKTEFARHYVRRVFNEFSVKISEKQMREVWLKDTPGASTPDGVRAAG